MHQLLAEVPLEQGWGFVCHVSLKDRELALTTAQVSAQENLITNLFDKKIQSV